METIGAPVITIRCGRCAFPRFLKRPANHEGVAVFELGRTVATRNEIQAAWIGRVSKNVIAATVAASVERGDSKVSRTKTVQVKLPCISEAKSALLQARRAGIGR